MAALRCLPLMRSSREQVGARGTKDRVRQKGSANGLLDGEEGGLRRVLFGQAWLRIPGGAGRGRLPLSYPYYLQVAFCVLSRGECLAQPGASPNCKLL